jgi:hypothetical protein
VPAKGSQDDLSYNWDRSANNLFVAPELKQKKGESVDGTECDVWSVGTICYLLMTGGQNDYKNKEKFEFKEPVWANCSTKCKKFFELIVQKKP